MRLIVTALCVTIEITRFGFAGHRFQKVAETFNICIVERRVDFVENADRRRVGQEQREDQRDGGQCLLPA